MDVLKALAYIVILTIVLAVSYSTASNFTPPQHEEFTITQHEVLNYTSSRPECPATNTSNTAVYLVDLIRAVGGIDYNYVFSPNLSNLNVTNYLIEYAKLGLLIPLTIGEGSTYRLTMLPVDRLNPLNALIYVCFPPKAIYPLYSVENVTTDTPFNVTFNVITPPPYAEISNLTVSWRALDSVVAEGYGEVLSTSLMYLGSSSYGPYCYEWGWGDRTYKYCYSYTYNRYRALWAYSIGYKVNGSVYSRTVSGSAELSGGGSGVRIISSDSEGYYMGFGPLARAEVTAYYYVDRERECTTEGNHTECYYHYEYGVSSVNVDMYMRGVRIDVKVNASIDFNTTSITGVEPIRTSIQRHVILEPRFNISIPVHFHDSINICNYFRDEVKCFGRTARNSFAGYIELAYIVENFDWPWGSVVDLPYRIVAEKRLHPPPYAPNIEINKVFYRHLQEMVLKYIARIVDAHASQTPYRDFEAWTLATQIPIQMNVCNNHSNSYMPLIEALQDGCGSDDERADVLSGILINLDIENEVREVVAVTTKGLEVINSTGIGVFGYIDSYPNFYDLAGLGCAQPLKNKYLVAYDTVQNNIFSVLDRIANMYDAS